MDSMKDITKRITKRSFRAWLKKQSDETHWVYTSNEECPIACYLKEELNLKNVCVMPCSFNANNGSYDIPEWLIQVLYIARTQPRYDYHLTKKLLLQGLNLCSPKKKLG